MLKVILFHGRKNFRLPPILNIRDGFKFEPKDTWCYKQVCDNYKTTGIGIIQHNETNGASYPWHLYDLKAEKVLPVMEILLIVQDGAMLNLSKGMRLDEDTAFQYVVQMASEVEKVGGVLTLLWHPNWIIQPDWWNLYLRTLKYLQKKKAWFGLMKEIGEWFFLSPKP